MMHLITLLALATPTVAFLHQPLSFARTRIAPSEAIAVFGGSGGVGSEVVYQQLQQGDSVSTLVRTASKLVIPPGSGGESKAGQPLTGANVVVGDVTRQADVDKVFDGQDITGVVVALGGKTKDVGPSMCTDGTACVIDACKRFGVKRIAVVSSIGAGDSVNQAPFFFKILMNTVMRSIFTDKNNQGSNRGKDIFSMLLLSKKVLVVTVVLGACFFCRRREPFLQWCFLFSFLKCVGPQGCSLLLPPPPPSAHVSLFFFVLSWMGSEALFFSGPGKDLEFTIVRPGGLTLEPPNGVINVIEGEVVRCVCEREREMCFHGRILDV
jgi:putative NADH-flavin reductase